MDYCVQLSFDNINAPELNGYGVDFVKVSEGLGCKAIRVFEPDDILPALETAKKMLVEFEVPVVVEVDPRAGDQRVDGHRDRRRRRVRGARRAWHRRPDRDRLLD
jgi:thiamine pyrophosphate-dependent acetolactate synthase large subunit-like protein